MRIVRVEDALWAAASAAARELGYRSVDVYLEDCLRRLADGQDPEQLGTTEPHPATGGVMAEHDAH